MPDTETRSLRSKPAARGSNCRCEKCHSGKDGADKDGRGGPVHPAWPTVEVTVSRHPPTPADGGRNAITSWQYNPKLENITLRKSIITDEKQSDGKSSWPQSLAVTSATRRWRRSDRPAFHRPGAQPDPETRLVPPGSSAQASRHLVQHWSAASALGQA